jgi:hypothetical protein
MNRKLSSDGNVWNLIADQLAAWLNSNRENPIGCADEICPLRLETTDPDNQVFLPFVYLTSETDEFPRESVRKYWNPAALADVDKRQADFLSKAAPRFWSEAEKSFVEMRRLSQLAGKKKQL